MSRRTARTVLNACVAVASVVAFAMIGTGSSAIAATRPGQPTKTVYQDMYVTFYGWYDNSPPGCGAAYQPCAGGKGTYADPITFASSRSELPVGTIIYYPTVEKYFVMGDGCTECSEDWKGVGPDGGPHLYHVDLWIGGKGANEFDAINCEDSLTQDKLNGAPLLTPVIVRPPADLGVSSEPLFNPHTNKCYGGATSPTTNGQYKNKGTGDCVDDPGNATTSPTAADAAACTGGPEQDVAFNGAFLSLNNLCLGAQGNATAAGTPIVWSTCTGDPGQQWELNASGTIAGIQSNECVSQSGTALVLAACTDTSGDEWAFKAEPAPSP